MPSLLLQPLIERHQAWRGPLAGAHPHPHQRPAAQRAPWLAGEGDLDANAPRRTEAAGFGIGLRNVAERIRVRFGEAGRLRVDTGSGTHFRAEIELPWKAA